ncbi:MAG: sigma-54-dependent Fis family transcriptional regulator [Planctomycetia bacterium]|nr:sigma-54-dependent Fis family transcriptional regulator [Planctomycetia bacterium]
MPARVLIVSRLADDLSSVDVLAVGAGRGSLRLKGSPREIDAATRLRLGEWLRDGLVTEATSRGGDDWLRACLPESLEGAVLVGPLTDRGRALGMLAVVAEAGHAFTELHRELVQQLLEPLAVALENDNRVHELRALREAAEADRQDRVELVARSDVPVLILGETGTGKEVVSRAIHTRSKRSDGPFIRVNCGAIPPELVDSQLFGHEKGAFTGAGEQHHGWFERADRGTLFLDEIGELPLPAQVRLLRVLQDHQIERIGSRAPTHVDVRIVAATHRDLAAMVVEKTFREDLWYRINIFPIVLPTLRERQADIPALAHHFVRRAATRFGMPLVEPSAADIDLLVGYHWPGNIRELGAVIDRAVILGAGRCLDVATALGLGRRPFAPSAPSVDVTLYEVIPESAPAPEVQPPASEIVSLADAMRRHVERALAATRGRIEGKRGAAEMLDINPHTLRARMKKLGIDPSRYRD